MLSGSRHRRIQQRPDNTMLARDVDASSANTVSASPIAGHSRKFSAACPHRGMSRTGVPFPFVSEGTHDRQMGHVAVASVTGPLERNRVQS
jgi:hypothetical protein